MADDIDVPAHLVALRKAMDEAVSDEVYVRKMGKVYSGTTARRVEWDIKCGLAEKRRQKAQSAYDAALKKYLEKQES